MDAHSGRAGDDATPHGESEVVRVRTCPGTFVFTERENTDGWIATDTVVDPEP